MGMVGRGEGMKEGIVWGSGKEREKGREGMGEGIVWGWWGGDEGEERVGRGKHERVGMGKGRK